MDKVDIDRTDAGTLVQMRRRLASQPAEVLA